MKGLAKKAVKYAEDHGFRFERQNSKGLLYYRNANGAEVCIPPGLADNALRNVCQQVDRACGIGPDLSQKRNPAAIKARRERERLLLKEEIRRDRQRLDELARLNHEQLLSGLGNELTLREIDALARLVEQKQRRHDELVRQMTARPAGDAA